MPSVAFGDIRANGGGSTEYLPGDFLCLHCFRPGFKFIVGSLYHLARLLIEAQFTIVHTPDPSPLAPVFQ